MTVADVEYTLARHADESEEDLTDDLYVAVKRALEHGAPRQTVKASLQSVYSSLATTGHRKERRAVGFVLMYLDGACSPVAAL